MLQGFWHWHSWSVMDPEGLQALLLASLQIA